MMFKCVCLTMLLTSACTFDADNQALLDDGGSADAPLATSIDGSILDADAFDQPQADAFVDPEACTGGVLATFEEGLQLGNFPEIGVYAGIDFEDTWTGYAAGQFGVPSAATSFNSNRSSGEFAFGDDDEEDDQRILRGFRAIWSGVPVTLTISDGINSDVAVSLDMQTPSAYVPTNWTSPSSRITVDSTAGFIFFLDDICHGAP